MYTFLIYIATATLCFAIRLPNNSALHFQLHRRGSRFSGHKPANLTDLALAITKVEEKYAWTYRDIENNRLVRRWRPEIDEVQMLDRAGLDGNWYFHLSVGNPSQMLEVDMDMLSPDFYTIMTSSGSGSKYDIFRAQSHGVHPVPGEQYIHPFCRLANDVINITSADQLRFDWPICQASHSSRHTLHKSGTILGLAPHKGLHTTSLARLGTPSFVEHLRSRGTIPTQLWSVTVLDSTSGVLSLGGTLATEMEEAKIRAELEMKYIGTRSGQQEMESEIKSQLSLLGASFEQQFQWLDIHGSAGWWTGLISGIWIDGVKVMKNQPFLIDINCPFILSPPQPFGHFYDSINGAKLLHALDRQFALFPCLNPPKVAFELAGWQFPLACHGTREDAIYGPTGGRCSLGKMNDLISPYSDRNESQANSGFCIGIVVKTRMGGREKWKTSGMKDVWILGEPFFRGQGIIFDSEKGRIGFRTY